MKLDSKKILTIGAGAVVGYLLFCKFMKSDAEKTLQGGEEVPTEEGSGGGGVGGGGFGGGSVGSFPPVIAPIIPTGYISLGNNIVAPLSGLNPNNPNQAVVNIATTQAGRETAPPPPSPTTRPSTTDVAGAPVVSVPSKTAKFSDFDGNPNFQDALL